MSSYNEETKAINCPYFEDCGACAYAGMKYDNELAIKTRDMEKLFKDITKVEPIVSMYRPIYYRNKVHAVVAADKKGNIRMGTYKENSHDVVDIKDCMIEDEVCRSIINTIKELMKSFKYKAYNEDTRQGFLRHILIRRGVVTKEVMLCLVTGDIAFPSKNNFLKEIRKRHPEITTILQNVNNSKTSMILGKRTVTLFGKGYIEDILCGLKFRLGISSFYQINHDQTEKLYKKAIKLANLTKQDTVIDAYCGIGTIGMAMSKAAGQVIGVELNENAIEDAKVNAKLNNIKNIYFQAADAGEFLVDYAASGRKANVVVMDPPRSGSSPEFLKSILKIKPDRVVYISCNPETQVRDIKTLIKGGYKISPVTPFDMFPHTVHTETVVLMTRVK